MRIAGYITEGISVVRIYLVQFRSYVIKSGILFLLLLAVIEGQRLSAQEEGGQDEQKQLQTIQQQLREKHAEYEQIQGKEQSILRELRAIDQQLKESQQKLQEYRKKLSENEEDLNKIQTNLVHLQQQYTKNNRALAKRVRAIYKMGDLGYLTPLFAISSQTNVQQHIKYLQRIAESDRQLMENAERDMQVILKTKEALEQRKQEIVHAQQEIEQQNLQIAAQKQQKNELLAKIRQDKNQFVQVIGELEASAAKLEQLMDNLETEEKNFYEKVIEASKKIIFPNNAQEVVQSYGQHFRANKGKLLWPVQGKIIKNFGPIKIGETYTQYKGVDIQAENGTPFYAVFKGAVKYADWFEGYGNLVILDHGGNFYTLYAHADELSVKSGDTVETRQVLGKVGDTDSIKGSYLYFEIRANGKPENPQTWLAKVQ
jgi:septal ring factor EnvC (AmiA/AmiB activator)